MEIARRSDSVVIYGRRSSDPDDTGVQRWENVNSDLSSLIAKQLEHLIQ